MTQSQVIRADGSNPIKRKAETLVYRDTESGIPTQVIFEFTAERLNQISYIAESPQDPEIAFLTWCLDLTKRYGQGLVYLNKKPVGRPGVVLDESLKRFWKQGSGEILVVYPPEGVTNVGVGIRFINGSPSVEMDYAETPKDKVRRSPSRCWKRCRL